MFDSRNELDVCSTRVLSSASARDTDSMSCSDFAPLALPRAAIELPGGDDDLLLRGDEIVDRCPGRRRASALALRERELLLERLHLEEEDVAARFARPLAAREIARAHVVGDEVAGLHVEILEEQRVPAVDRRRLARNASGTTFSASPRTA